MRLREKLDIAKDRGEPIGILVESLIWAISAFSAIYPVECPVFHSNGVFCYNFATNTLHIAHFEDSCYLDSHLKSWVPSFFYLATINVLLPSERGQAGCFICFSKFMYIIK
jgi:hypothetical protein